MDENIPYRITIIDLAVIVIILLVSAFSFHLLPKKQIGKKCLIIVDEKPYAKLDLSADTLAQIDVHTSSGRLELQYGKQGICVLKSTCSNKICVKQGWISRAGESLICAPNLFIAVIPAEPGALDAVSE
jgi:hypothetical protein